MRLKSAAHQESSAMVVFTKRNMMNDALHGIASRSSEGEPLSDLSGSRKKGSGRIRATQEPRIVRLLKPC